MFNTGKAVFNIKDVMIKHSELQTECNTYIMIVSSIIGFAYAKGIS